MKIYSKMASRLRHYLKRTKFGLFALYPCHFDYLKFVCSFRVIHLTLVTATGLSIFDPKLTDNQQQCWVPMPSPVPSRV